MNNIEETSAVADALDFLEDIQSYVRDLLHTIEVNGDDYVKSAQFQSDVEHLKGVVARGI